MIEQLVQSLQKNGAGQEDAGLFVLTADPLDILLHLEAVWNACSATATARPVLTGLAGLGALGAMQKRGTFARHAPAKGTRTWDHLASSYMIENSRAVQIFARVTRALRTGETLGAPSPATCRWLVATEVLLSGVVSIGTPAGGHHEAQEASRRNAYWRLFGLDLGFGTDANAQALFKRPAEANTDFVPFLEALLALLSESFETASGPETGAVNATGMADASGKLRQSLLDRRNLIVDRQELLAATLLGWIELSLTANSPLVRDLALEGSSSAERLQDLGARVALPAHAKTANLFALAPSLSKVLRLIEDGASADTWADGSAPAAHHARRVITEWAAATGRNLG